MKYSVRNILTRLIGLLIVISLTGCVIVTPPQEDRLSGLASPEQLKSGPSVLTGTSKMKLAIVSSVNVPKSLEANSDMMGRFTGFLAKVFTMTNNSYDASIVLSSDKFLEAAIAPLRERFLSVTTAKDLRDAFTSGADIVAILDLRLAHDFTKSPGTNGMMDVMHTSNVSYLFINRRLEQGPDLVANVSYPQSTRAAGADANNRDHLVHVRDARIKTLLILEQEAAQKLQR